MPSQSDDLTLTAVYHKMCASRSGPRIALIVPNAVLGLNVTYAAIAVRGKLCADSAVGPARNGADRLDGNMNGSGLC